MFSVKFVRGGGGKLNLIKKNFGLNSVYPPELYTKNYVSSCTFNLISNTPIFFSFISLIPPSVKINGLTVK